MKRERPETCVSCQGDIRGPGDHAGFDLCYRCYRNAKRNIQREARAVAQAGTIDLHNPAFRKEHKQLIRGLASILSGLTDIRASKAAVLSVREIITPFVAPILPYLPEDPLLELLPEPKPLNTEQQNRKSAFSVHSITAVKEEQPK
jgi:hypothetical protein